MADSIKTVPPRDEPSPDLKTAEGDAVEAEFSVYLADESRYGPGAAEKIVFARTEADIAAALRTCRESATQATISAARTGIVAGAVPFGGVLISVENMKAMSDVTAVDDEWRLTVGPGATLDEIAEHIAASGIDCLYPPDPTERTASVGGTVATNASGARTFHYGPTRNFVAALRVVLPCGEALALSRGEGPSFDESGKVSIELASGNVIALQLPSYKQPGCKNVAGYYAAPGMELIDLFIGSEGTLGVVSEITLRLVPRPEVLACLAFMKDEAGALSLTAALRNGEPRPLAIEYFDGGALDMLRRKRASDGAGSIVPAFPDGAGAALSFEFAYATEDELDERAMALDELLPAHGSSMDDTWAAFDADEAERIKTFRHCVPETVNSLVAERKREHSELHKVGTDMVVPADKLGETLAAQRAALDAEGLEYVVFGHIGDSHLHLNILPRNAAELARSKELYTQFARAAVAAGGSVAGEHGIGKVKKALLIEMYGEESVEQMRALKRAIDPDGLLNRDDVFSWTRGT